MDDALLKTFITPAFPEELIERYPSMEQAFADFRTVELGDYDVTNNYGAFIDMHWDGVPIPFKQFLTVHRRLDTSL